jgi:hypothetical protein
VTSDTAIRRLTAAAVLLVAAIAAVVSFVHIEHLAVTHGQTVLAAMLLPVSIDGTVAAASLVMLRAARAGLGTPWLARVMLGLSVVATLAANIAYGARYGLTGSLLSGWPAVAFIGSAEMAIGMVRRVRNAPVPEAPDPEQLLTGTRTALYRLRNEAGELLYVGVSLAPDFRFYDHARLKDWWPEVCDKSVEWFDSRDDAFAAERAAIAAEQPKYNIVKGTVPFVPQPYLNGSALHPDEAEPFAAELARGEVPTIRRIRSELHCGQPRAQEIQGKLAALTRTCANSSGGGDS